MEAKVLKSWSETRLIDMKMNPLSSTIFHHYLQSIIITFYLLTLPQASVSAINGVSKDSDQLLSFKDSLPNPTLLHDWLPSNDPCNFTGVSCKNDRVSAIDLSNKNLSIDFNLVSSSLISLQSLESLVLMNVNLSGSLTSLSKSQCGVLLSSIDLSGNSISGPVSDIFTIGVCSNIVLLNLSRNSLDPLEKEDIKVLSFAIQVLDLSYNNISGLNLLSWLLSNQSGDLQYLSLKGNKLAGDVPSLDFKNLTFLDLSMNNFSTGFPTILDCSNLYHLDLSSNRFVGEIGNSISLCGKLNFLNLTSNQLTGALPKLPSNGNIKFLYLKENTFQGVLPTYISDLCSSLVELDLGSNNISGTVPIGFDACSSMELFDISSNNFSGELPINTILKMSKLRSLYLSFNNFVGDFPESLSNMVNLEIFDVSSNNLMGSIPSGICNVKNNLQFLYLQNNMFTGPIPEGLSNCTELVSLDLSFNYLTGSIPSSLGSLSKLRDLIAWLNQLEGQIPQELMYLQSLENLILDFNDLNGSIPASLSSCVNLNWISLSNNQLTGEIPPSLGRLSNLAILKLGNNSISGSIPGELGDCKSLLWVDLNTNLLNGNIPATFFKQSGYIAVAVLTGKSYVYIRNDGSKQCHGAGNLLEFGGIRQEQLDRISSRHPCNFTRVYKGITQPTFNHNGSMIFLDLSHNLLQGSIPKEMGSLYYLQILNLGHNDLSGPIPQELSGLKNVAILDLSYNKLNGSIPQSLTSLTLIGDIDLSNNFLGGSIPELAPFDTFPENRFDNNSGLCGYPLPSCSISNRSGSSVQKSRRRKDSLIGSVAMGLLFSLFCIVALILVLIEMKKRRKKEEEAAVELYLDTHSHSGNNTNTLWKLSARDLSINLSTFEKPLKNLTFADLLQATNNFHNDAHIGSGGFGDVYKAQLKDGSIVAIKKLIQVSGDREFTAEMETIGKVKHRNLVPLLGYCKVGEERLLVYEYMKFGSLEDVLHDRKRIGLKLNWSARRKIGLDSARGLAFLHHSCIPHIIHRDMKSSNVLLDDNLEARVSDFGMARNMNAVDTHLSVSTFAGTPGYVPPEYFQSFRCSTKGDVYSYGVVLLELLTGKHPTDSVDFGDNNNLVGWVKQHAKMGIRDVFDRELLKDDPSLEIELLQHLKVAVSCLDDRPWKRPTMIQVMAMFKEIQTGSGHDSISTVATEKTAI